MRTIPSNDSFGNHSITGSENSCSAPTGRFAKWLRPSVPEPAPAAPAAPAGRLQALRSRVGACYERVFEGQDADPDGRGEAFWSELWLMRPDRAHLLYCFDKVTEQELLRLAPSIAAFVAKAGDCFACTSEAPRRRVHAAETLSCCFRGVLGKTGWGHFGREAPAVLFGEGGADAACGALMTAVRAAVSPPADSPSPPPEVAVAALGTVDALALGHPRCGRNTIAEIAARHLSPPAGVYGAPFARAGAAADLPPGEPPDAVALRCLDSLACLATYAHFEVSELGWQRFFAPPRDPQQLRGLLRCCRHSLHCYSRDFLVARRQPGPLAAASTGVLSRLSGWVGGLRRGHADPASPPLQPQQPQQQQQRQVHTQSGPAVPAAALSTLLILHHLAACDAAEEVLISGEQYPPKSQQFAHCGLGDVSGAGSALFVELVLASSIVLQGITRDPASTCAARLVLFVWREFLNSVPFLEFLHRPVHHALAVAEKRASANWHVGYAGGGGVAAPASALLWLLSLFFRVNLRSRFNAELYDACVSCLGRILLFELEAGSPIACAVSWPRLFEGLLQLLALLTRPRSPREPAHDQRPERDELPPALSSSAAGRLLRKLAALLRLCCAQDPSPFPGTEVRGAFIYELVRQCDVIDAADKLAQQVHSPLSALDGVLAAPAVAAPAQAAVAEAAAPLGALSTLSCFVAERIGQLWPSNQAPPSHIVAQAVSDFSEAHPGIARSLASPPAAERALLGEPVRASVHDAGFFHQVTSASAEALRHDAFAAASCR